MNKDKIKDALRYALKKDHAQANKKEAKRTPVIILVVMATLILGLQYTTTFFSSGSGTDSQKDISVPSEENISSLSVDSDVVSDATVQGTITGNEVSVIIETKNLEPGTCVWLAVDKPELGLCWPKAHRIEPNTKVQIKILKEGPKEPYRLSLYALNEYFDKQWQDWVDHKMFGGLHMPPDSKRLASVEIVLGNQTK